MMEEKTEKAFALVLIELEKAKAKHADFPGGAGAVSIIAEELGELAQEVNDMYVKPDFEDTQDRITMEAAHVAVTAIRLIEKMIEKAGGK